MVQSDHRFDAGFLEFVNQASVISDPLHVHTVGSPIGKNPRPGNGKPVVADLNARRQGVFEQMHQGQNRSNCGATC